jgi:hypothetical protein
MDVCSTKISHRVEEFAYPASIPLSTATLTRLSDLVRGAPKVSGTRRRRLDTGRQALLVLAHLRNG